MKVGIIVAMDKELRQLQSLFTDGNVLVQKCGIGKVNAALGAQRMINEFHPDVIISSGCAGGNGDDVNIQDVVVSSQDVKVHPGLIVTGDWFVDSKEKMREIIGHFPDASAVDMESCAIAQTCYINKVEFISFRVVSDIPLRDTDASQYHNFWDTVAEHSFEVTKNFVATLMRSGK